MNPELHEKTLVVIPVYNHAGTLLDVAKGVLAEGFPLLVVDDGSADDPLSRLKGLPVQCLSLPENQGKGAALLAGARWAQEKGYTCMMTLDADGQHHPLDLPGMLEAARGSFPCIVLGKRDLSSPHVPASSRFGRAFSNFWVRLETGVNLEDTQSGFRVYPVDFLTETPFWTRHYTFEIEVLVRAAWAGFAILEHPIHVTYQPGSARISHFHAIRDNARLSFLHTGLMVRRLFSLGGGKRGAGASEWHEIKAKAHRALRHPWTFTKTLAKEHASPLELAVAVWLGVFIGCLPIIPFGLAVIFYVSRRLKLNPLASMGASNLCVAPFVPFVCIQAGHWLLNGRFWTEFSRQRLINEIPQRMGEWALGALVLGPVLGAMVAVLLYGLLRRLSAR